MSVSKELMELLTAALGSDAGSGKSKAPGRPRKPAPPEISNINGIDIVDSPRPGFPTTGSKPQSAGPAAPKPKAKKVKVAGGAESDDGGGHPAPVAAAAPKAKRSQVRAMPHRCDCPMCPLKD